MYPYFVAGLVPGTPPALLDYRYIELSVGREEIPVNGVTTLLLLQLSGIYERSEYFGRSRGLYRTDVPGIYRIHVTRYQVPGTW
jgi:hypothetical protein